MIKKEQFNISYLQYDITWKNWKKNLEKIEQLLGANIPETDLIVLPEMFTTGFSVASVDAAEDIDNAPTLLWMKSIAAKYNCAITGSFGIRESNHVFNRMYFVKPDGTFCSYDKKHLFKLSEEPKNYTPGNKNAIVDYLGWKFNLVICYDLRFPIWLRNRFDGSNYDYDVLLVPANWPTARVHVWNTLLKARSIENQCYVVGVNRIGTDGNGIDHNGHSQVCDFNGNMLIHSDEKEGIFNTSLSMNSLEKQRNQYSFASDWDSFLIP